MTAASPRFATQFRLATAFAYAALLFSQSLPSQIGSHSRHVHDRIPISLYTCIARCRRPHIFKCLSSQAPSSVAGARVPKAALLRTSCSQSSCSTLCLPKLAGDSLIKSGFVELPPIWAIPATTTAADIGNERLRTLLSRFRPSEAKNHLHLFRTIRNALKTSATTSRSFATASLTGHRLTCAGSSRRLRCPYCITGQCCQLYRTQLSPATLSSTSDQSSNASDSCLDSHSS